mgnify:CR=1 FL=1
MTVRRPLVQIAGVLQELPSGDSIAGASGSALAATVTVDFGSSGKRTVSQAFTVTGASTSQTIVASASLDMPGSLSPDELEMDHIVAAAMVTATDTVLVVASSNSVVGGQRNINLILV